jgi:hypothetical protein
MDPIIVALAILAFLLFVVPAALLPLIGGSEPELEPVPVVARSAHDAASRARLEAALADGRADDGRIAA